MFCSQEPMKTRHIPGARFMPIDAFLNPGPVKTARCTAPMAAGEICARVLLYAAPVLPDLTHSRGPL